MFQHTPNQIGVLGLDKIMIHAGNQIAGNIIAAIHAQQGFPNGMQSTVRQTATILPTRMGQ